MKKATTNGFTVTGGGLKNTVKPKMIIGEERHGYVKGDILDANATIDLLVRSDGVLNEKFEVLIKALTQLNKSCGFDIHGKISKEGVTATSLLDYIQLLEQRIKGLEAK